MNKLNKLIFIGFFLFTCLSGKAQQLFFSGYNISDGLSQSVVNCIFQDSKGYVWFGTQNGLNRFDGISFKVFTYVPNDTTSISNNWIYSIAEDRQGNLWIATKGGLNKYFREENRFEKILYSTPFTSDITGYVYDVKCDRKGNILINTPPVLTICNPENMVFSHSISELLYDGSVKDCNIPLLEAANGNIWIGSTCGLACYNPSDGHFEVYTHDQLNPATISDNNITALCQDNQGDIWIGTQKGLNLFNQQSQSFKRYFHNRNDTFSLSNNFIRAILCDYSGKLWIATEGGGLNRMSRNADRRLVFEVFYAGSNSLNHNIIQSLAIDRTNNLWIGTLSGVNKTDLKKQKFRLYQKNESPYSVELAGNVIASLYKDRNDMIWVGNWGQGLNIYDRKSGKVEHYASNLPGRNYIPNDYVHTIYEDSAHFIWIGTRDGLLVYQEQTRSFVRPHQFIHNPGLPDFTGLRIFMMMQECKGNYWIATQDGLFKTAETGSEPIRFHSAAPPGYRISSNLVYAVIEDREGLIWIATTEGLDVFDPATSQTQYFRKTEKKENSLTDNFITALCEDHNGDIWIGTSSYVNKFSKQEAAFTYYSKEHGLPGNQVYSILEDKSNGLWIATGNGLCCLDSADNTFHAYSDEEGLQSQEFNLGAAFLSQNGEVFFGGMNGFNSFYPDSLSDNPHIPPIVFTSAYKNKKGTREYFDLEKSNTIILNHNDYSFTVEFAALEFTNPTKNLYQYRLEGIDDEWIETGNRNFIPFSNLPPGEYLLRVKGSNNDGLWNEEGASLNILIHPPWWRSDLAWLTYILLVNLIIYLIVKRREQQHARDKKVLEEKVNERTQQIEKQKAEIVQKNLELKELNASKDKFFSIIAHDLRNPFNSIIGLTDILLMSFPNIEQGKLHKSLENIKGSSRQAYELLENLLLWARSHTGTMVFRPEIIDLKYLVKESIKLVSAQADRKNIQIHTEFIHNATIQADKNMIMTILRNLLTNALKFSYQNGNIWVRLFPEDDFCVLSIKDHGLGISKEKIGTLFNIDTSHKTKGTGQEPGTGLGLILCKEFVEKHRGKILVDSEPGKGSEFRVMLPANMT